MLVFVSYRRDDNPWVAGRLRDRLAETFDGSNVFFDVDDIPLGVDFREVIRSTLADVNVVLAVIGSGWNPERLNDKNDPVRAELHEALQQKKRVIPVLIGDTSMPKPDALPVELESFAYLNATRLRPDPDFATDATRLIAGIRAGNPEDDPTTLSARSVVDPGVPRLPPQVPEPPARVPRVSESRPVAPSIGGASTPRRARRFREWLAVGVAVVVVVILAAVVVALLAGNGDESANTGTHELVLDGKARGFVETGVVLSGGEQVTINATGEIGDDPAFPENLRGPAGVDPDRNDPFYAENWNHAALIGRIGRQGEPFLVGDHHREESSSSGMLYLRINDEPTKDNSGHFNVSIDVQRP